MQIIRGPAAAKPWAGQVISVLDALGSCPIVISRRVSCSLGKCWKKEKHSSSSCPLSNSSYLTPFSSSTEHSSRRICALYPEPLFVHQAVCQQHQFLPRDAPLASPPQGPRRAPLCCSHIVVGQWLECYLVQLASVPPRACIEFGRGQAIKHVQGKVQQSISFTI